MTPEATTSEVRTSRKWPKRLFIMFIVIAVLCALLLLTARIAMRTSWGHKFVENKIEAMAPMGQSVDVTGLSGDLLGRFEIEAMTVSDASGTWMSARDVDVIWSPWPLLRRDVVIDTLSVSTAKIMRRPVLISSTEPTSITFKSYTLGAFNIPRLDLAKALTGKAVSLSAKGSAGHGEDGGQLRLNSQTLNASIEDSTVIDLHWSPQFLLSGDAKIVGEAGGLIAGLLNLGTQDTFYLDVKTSGTQKNLTTTLDGRLDTRSFLTGEIRKIGNAAEITANLSPNVIPKLASFNDILGGDVTLTASLNELSKETEISAVLVAPKLGVDLVAAKSAKGYVFPKLDVTARTPLSTFPDTPVSVETVRLNGSGALEGVITFSGRVQASSVKYDDYEVKTISGPLTFELRDTALNFYTGLTGDISTLESFTKLARGNPKLVAKGRYNFQTKRLVLTASDIQLPGMKLAAKGQASLSETTADMSGSFSLEKGILGGKIPASLTGKFTTQTIGGKIALNVTGNAKDLDTLPAPLAQLVGDDILIDARAVIKAGRGITLSKLSATGDAISLNGSGGYNLDGTILADVSYEAETFQVSSTVISSVEGRAKIAGKIGAIDFDVSGNIPELTSSNQTLSNVEFIAKGQQSGKALTADIAATADSEGGAVSIETKATYEGGQWQASGTKVDLGALSIKGNLSGRGSDLALLSGNFTVSGDPSNYLPAKSANFDVTLSNSVVDVRGELTEINAGPLTDGTLKILAKGPRDAVNFDINLEGDTVITDISRGLYVKATGLADLTLPRASLATDITGTLGQNKISTITALTLAQTENGLRGDGTLSLFGGNLSFALDDKSDSLLLIGQSLKLADILPLMGRAGLEGHTEFEAKFRKTPNGFDADLSGALNGMRQPGSDAAALDATLSGQIVGNQLTMRVDSNSGALSGNTSLGGTVTTISAPPFVQWPPQSPLRGVASAEGSITSLMDLFMPPETNVGGDLSLDMKYSLPLEARGMNGTMSLANGSFEQGDIGLTLKEINFASIFDGTTISVSRFSAKDGMTGTLTANGKMDIGFADGSTINLTAKKLRVLDRREGFAVMSGDLKLIHNGETLTLKGKLIVDDASVSIDNFPRAGRPTLDVNFSSADLDDTDEKPVRTATELDVTLSSPSRIKLTGRGVNASMSLNAHVTGAFNDPVLSGETAITRGRFNFLGKRFALNDSKVIFNDDVMESRLAVAAIRETSDLTASINVKGTISRPEVELTSTPLFPEDEVLSRILFGRSASQLTTIETARLAAALAQLSGGSGFDLMGGLENALGLDTLDFGQSENGQTQLTTGKYLSDNVYVEVRGSAEGTPGLAVEWTPKKNLSIEAETAPGETQRVSVQWKKDFD